MNTLDTTEASSSLEREDAKLPEQLARGVLARCDALATCTSEAGTINRSFLSPAMMRCNAMTAEWMEAAGMQVSLDKAGNLRGVYEASLPDAPRLIIGSHLDTVPAAGRYDGVLGVMIGIMLVESLRGEKLPFAIEVIGFSDEEGVRFGLPFIGSRATVGALSKTHCEMLDTEGMSLDAALEDFCKLHPNAIDPELSPTSRAYLEFHIEQGPVLDEMKRGLSTVNAVIGQSRATLTFHGQPAHAGTTPMAMRQDAMLAAAEWMLAVESTARATDGIVATTGQVRCEPGASNIVPGLVRCSLDLRTSDDLLRCASMQNVLGKAKEISERRGVSMRHTIEVDQAMVPLDESLTELARRSVTAVGGQSTLMVSGAGHDAMIMASHLPAAMIFLRSPKGVSHNPAEAVLAEDVADALCAGLHFLAEFPQWLENNEDRL